MPRLTQRQVLLEELLAIVQQVIHLMVYDAGEDLMDLLEELSEVYKIIAAHRYIAARKISAGRHLIFQGPSVLENLIKNYPDSAFLNLFRMHRSSFWALVDIVTPMWPVIAMTKKRPRPIYQQLLSWIVSCCW
ncbi:hypothetical protein EV426DRAFT_699798 [Tirmania nivea]|nr:hypothetical protein EV426DRAFT_699798 [Tirmania nivea]